MDIRRRMLFKKKASSSGGATGGSYTVNLNSQWEKTTAVTNPDSTLYDGVYRSVSNYNVHNGVATMYITIKDCSSFTLYIRSYAESNYDYVMVSQIDKTITGSTTYSDTTLVKAHTRGNQQSGTALSSYTLVEFTGISSGEHTITVVYRKDGSQHSGDDRGYVLIGKSQVGSGDNEGSNDTNNYLTIVALEDGLNASLSTNACEYCIDGTGNWKTLAAGTATESINAGQTLSFRANLTPAKYIGVGTFTVSKQFNLKGDCMSLLYGDNAVDNYSLSGRDYAFYNLFENCSNLISCDNNVLKATTLSGYCYGGMFDGCANLTTAPELPSTTTTTHCYSSMFRDCVKLTTPPPILHAASVNEYSYAYMFDNCKSLIETPILNISGSIRDYGCYYMFVDCDNLQIINWPTVDTAYIYGDLAMAYMFMNCKKLNTPNNFKVPKVWYDPSNGYCPFDSVYNHAFYNTAIIPDYSKIDFNVISVTRGVLEGLFAGTKITDNDLFAVLPINTDGKYYLPRPVVNYDGYRYAYKNMFKDCVNLITAPELPSKAVEDGCYESMFEGCTNLINAPTLPAEYLDFNCYKNMFKNCSSLNYIKMLVTSYYTSQKCLDNWVTGVASTGTFVKHPDMTTLPIGTSGIPHGWTVVDAINIDNYLTIVALEDGLNASLSTNACEYCIDGADNWKTLAAGTATESINRGHTISFRGELTPNDSNGIGTFTISKKCNLKGNCMSMLFGDNAANNYSLEGKFNTFYKLFYGCSNIINISNNFLPATTLAGDCYYRMFQGCTRLLNTPYLPATTLTDNCYVYMFRDCINLTTAPELPATTLASYCYYAMFESCTGLTTAPELPATTLAEHCYSNMFYGCTNLTTAPTLHATTLADSCYSYMFYNCNKLNYIKMLATNISASNCLYAWVSGVASSGTFEKHPDTIGMSRGIGGIPIEWTVVYDGGESVMKPINVLRLSPQIDKSNEFNIIFSFDFPPTSNLEVVAKTDSLTERISINLSANVQSGIKHSVDMGASKLVQILSYAPAEDDTYIYDVVIE